MRALQRVSTALPRATALRTIATRPTTTTDTLHANRKASANTQPNDPTATSTTTPLDFPSNQGVYGADWSSHFTACGNHQHQHPDHRTRAAFHSTQIYHGQARPSNRCGIHSSSTVQGSTAPLHTGTGTGPGPGPATGAGTGVLISAQMFGTEVKGNPTESEADVAADRSDDDPLPPHLHRTIRLGAGDAAPRMTESEEDVVADRGTGGEDPLVWPGKKVTH